MTHELLFTPRQAVPLGPEALVQHFSARPHYKVEGYRASYHNEDTEVYFQFEHLQHEVPEAGSTAFAIFNLNYARPRVFALEAEMELEAFTRELPLLVLDPQVLNASPAEFHAIDFLKSWTVGNERACHVLINLPDASSPPPTLPSQIIETTWRWNLGKSAFQAQMGDGIFVPPIWYIRHEGKTLTATVWTDGIPCTVPVVDMLLIPRQGLAPRRAFAKTSDMAIASFESAGHLLNEHPLVDAPHAYRLLEYMTPPKALAAWIRALPPVSTAITRVPLELLLERELIERLVNHNGT